MEWLPPQVVYKQVQSTRYRPLYDFPNDMIGDDSPRRVVGRTRSPFHVGCETIPPPLRFMFGQQEGPPGSPIAIILDHLTRG